MLSRFVPSASVSHSSVFLQLKARKSFKTRSFVCNPQTTYGGCGRGEWDERLDHVEKLLSREWLMPEPNTRISKIEISNLKAPQSISTGSLERVQFSNEGYLEAGQRDNADDSAFYVIRDDLLHPLLGGNKIRKLDAIIPELERMGATDVVTCGGCQSAHTAALAFACAERGISAHLLLRGERPSIPTGYNLLCGMYGHVSYIPRCEYSDRAGMLSKHASILVGSSGSMFWLDAYETAAAHSSETLERRKSEGECKNVVVVKEGAGDAIALLGLIRLVHYLSQPTVFGRGDPLHVVVDTGTGTTAVGLALGIALLGLPWKVTGVILADSVENYEKHTFKLISDFSVRSSSLYSAGNLHLPLLWEPRLSPRKFGKVLSGEIEICHSIARHTGILLDPIYTLAGWETAVKYSVESQGSHKTVMVHTGGTLGLFGLAQRFPEQFA